MGYLDLEELKAGALELWPVFSTKSKWALLSFLPKDHMINEHLNHDLATNVRDVVERETGERPQGPIRLLTNLRVLGVEFNPVSFYYVFEPNGKTLGYVVAEVGNFPWFEQHNYVIKPTGPPEELQKFNSHGKAFHVSPFMGMDMEYDWLVSAPDKNLRVRINLKGSNEGRMFMASLDARRVEWSVWQLLRLQLVYPMHTIKVMSGILFEAWKLFRRGFLFRPHPEGAETWASKVVEVCVYAGSEIKACWCRCTGRAEPGR